ncbi:MAG: Cation diffusion facilitator transporter family protein, partial [Ramlibacter sp.]|nr:Cation diffusion facilitator transporter family protein [Ramlibacter sp.]
LFSEAVHSFVDTGNELLLLWGIRRAELLPDEQFPFGHGREIYFWSFVVAMLVFVLGAVVSFLKGIAQISAPSAIERPAVIFIVLALSALFEGATWIISLTVFRRTGARRSFWRALQRSKDPPKFMVLLEDSAALLGLAIAAVGTWLAVSLDEPRFDGLASVLIGVLLTAVALVLGAKTKDLLIGERASPELIQEVMQIVAGFEGVEHANGVLTTQLAPDQVIAIASIAFADSLRTPQIERLVEDIETAVIAKRPEIGRLFVKPQTPQSFEAALKLRFESGVTPAARQKRRRRGGRGP